MKKEKNTKAQEVKKTNLVEGINNLIEEKAEKVEKSKKALKVVGKEKEATEKASEKKVKSARCFPPTASSSQASTTWKTTWLPSLRFRVWSPMMSSYTRLRHSPAWSTASSWCGR